MSDIIAPALRLRGEQRTSLFGGRGEIMVSLSSLIAYAYKAQAENDDPNVKTFCKLFAGQLEGFQRAY